MKDSKEYTYSLENAAAIPQIGSYVEADNTSQGGRGTISGRVVDVKYYFYKYRDIGVYVFLKDAES